MVHNFTFELTIYEKILPISYIGKKESRKQKQNKPPQINCHI